MEKQRKNKQCDVESTKGANRINDYSVFTSENNSFTYQVG